MSSELSQTKPAEWLNEPTLSRVEEIIQFLTEQGTFRFPALDTGLFSAAAFEHAHGEDTGYSNVWTRDVVHIAHALWVLGQRDEAARAMLALGKFYTGSKNRFTDLIADPALAADPMRRPHIRFAGHALEELPEKWSHAQNDALGYWLWLTCKMVLAEQFKLTDDLAEVLRLLVRYFQAVQYWQDEDSGHWEEVRKVAASSIGAAVAGLKAFRNVVELELHAFADRDELLELTCQLIDKGYAALDRILPHECVDGDEKQVRQYDGALLFLIYPLEVVSGPVADQIVADVTTHLQGPIGIRRYLGDSYWCADYKELLSAESRTADFSDDLNSRDALLKEGTEAQWCIFDPIASVIHGRRFLELGTEEDRIKQLEHLQRSLAQLTTAESRFGAYRCPESYFLEKDKWVPNDITPLLWTQANLRLALHWMRQTLVAQEGA
ncbi:MAG: phosphorylase kinase [Planctomycetaceae bacterium]|nr:phosphorylase kinase [Planctomycetaceae bacterium]MCB9949382.1 phosphorylase kinase [Planctomycetaceae bacterium]